MVLMMKHHVINASRRTMQEDPERFYQSNIFQKDFDEAYYQIVYR